VYRALNSLLRFVAISGGFPGAFFAVFDAVLVHLNQAYDDALIFANAQ
jgi:hypothetical protein